MFYYYNGYEAPPRCTASQLITLFFIKYMSNKFSRKGGVCVCVCKRKHNQVWLKSAKKGPVKRLAEAEKREREQKTK